MEKQLIPQGYFILNSDYGFVHISKTGSLTNGNTDLGSRNWVSALKTFLFQKRKLFF